MKPNKHRNWVARWSWGNILALDLVRGLEPLPRWGSTMVSEWSRRAARGHARFDSAIVQKRERVTERIAPTTSGQLAGAHPGQTAKTAATTTHKRPPQ
ncbi:MAG: hypothetical protein AAB372_01810 [Patescibacteria group bacterium]